MLSGRRCGRWCDRDRRDLSQQQWNGGLFDEHGHVISHNQSILRPWIQPRMHSASAGSSESAHAAAWQGSHAAAWHMHFAIQQGGLYITTMSFLSFLCANCVDYALDYASECTDFYVITTTMRQMCALGKAAETRENAHWLLHCTVQTCNRVFLSTSDE